MEWLSETLYPGWAQSFRVVRELARERSSFQDLVVVETADAILVCHRDAVQEIKKVVKQLPTELL